MRPSTPDLTRAPARSRTAEERPQLIALFPLGTAVHALAPGSKVTVGRDSRCDLVIDHPSVSRMHAAVHGGPPVEVEDLGSTNGTRVDGFRLESSEPSLLERGDVITIGSAILVVTTTAEKESVPLRRSEATEPHGREIALVIEDEVMVELHRMVELVAKTGLPILLVGEQGVGRGIVADTIHRRSDRAAGPFVRVDCATVTESELFGYARGAFPGATASRPGLLEEASGGTVFLAGIEQLSPATQVKLADALAQRSVTRLGDLERYPIDVRVVSSTHEDLPELVSVSAFHPGLAFRLTAVRLTVPPLRARPREIEPLARLFVEAACRREGRAPLAISEDALALLRRHDFPGNLPELRAALDRAVQLTTGETIRVAHLFPLGSLDEESTLAASKRAEAGAPLGAGGDVETDLKHAARRAAASVERQRIAEAMDACGGNQTKAAAMLGISRRTLVTRLAEYGFPRPRQKRTTED